MDLTANQRAELDEQLAQAPLTLARLRELGIDAARALQLEFFYYVEDEGAATELHGELVARDYDVSVLELPDEQGAFVVTGWSTPLLMEDDLVHDWVRGMCLLGFEHGAAFDGWGAEAD